jgi:hypothetical protein
MALERPAVTTEPAPAAALRADGAGLSLLVRTFGRPMGIAGDGRRLALANTPMRSEGSPEGCLSKKPTYWGARLHAGETYAGMGSRPP